MWGQGWLCIGLVIQVPLQPRLLKLKTTHPIDGEAHAFTLESKPMQKTLYVAEGSALIVAAIPPFMGQVELLLLPVVLPRSISANE